MDIEETDFNLHTLIDNCFTAFKYQAQSKGLFFVYTIDPDVPHYLAGDPARLRQILTNLTGNALKFTEKGSIEIICILESYK
jgi:signal transduction histidine kinase